MEQIKKLRMGIDGGGTKTKCVIIDDKLNVVGSSQCGSTNINSLGEKKTVENLKSLIDDAISSLKKPCKKEMYNIVSIGLGMSGCDRDEDQKRLIEWTKKLLLTHNKLPFISIRPEVNIRVDNDAINVISAGTMGSVEGLVLISGTGFICYGFANNGTLRSRAGGWGPKLLDQGSGYYVGQQVLVKITEMHDGLRKKTRLYDTILEKLKLSSPSELIPYVYNECTEWSKIAALSKDCFDLFYDHGDETAEEIINDVVDVLFRYVKKVAEKIVEQKSEKSSDEIKLPLVFSGSILTHENSIVNKRLRERIKNKMGNLISSITFPKVSLEIGAALSATSNNKISE